MNRVENTAHIPGCFSRFHANQTGAACGSLLHHTRTEGYGCHGSWCSAPETANRLTVSVFLLPLSLTYREADCLAVRCSACKQARPRSRSWKNTRELSGGWTRAFLSDLWEKTPLSLAGIQLQRPHPPRQDQHWCWFALDGALTGPYRFLVYTRSGGPQA